MIKKFIERKQKKYTRIKKFNLLKNQILTGEQKSLGIKNIHCFKTDNVGDVYCAPHHYFDELKSTELDVFDSISDDDTVRLNFKNEVLNNSLIIGGGGLLNRSSFQKQMKIFEELSVKGKKIVLWGLGHNEKSSRYYGKSIKYSLDVSNFGLVGTRDKEMSENYVPCVSCLNSVFDDNYSIENELGIVFHKNSLRDKELISKFDNVPCSSNNTNFKELIQFIGTKESIITDSYHVMYWSHLLGKKVAVVPNSSKFYNFHIPPLITSFDSCLDDIKKAVLYTGVKEECRELNLNFSKKVFDYLA